MIIEKKFDLQTIEDCQELWKFYINISRLFPTRFYIFLDYIEEFRQVSEMINLKGGEISGLCDEKWIRVFVSDIVKIGFDLDTSYLPIGIYDFNKAYDLNDDNDIKRFFREHEIIGKIFPYKIWVERSNKKDLRLHFLDFKNEICKGFYKNRYGDWIQFLIIPYTKVKIEFDIGSNVTLKQLDEAII